MTEQLRKAAIRAAIYLEDASADGARPYARLIAEELRAGLAATPTLDAAWAEAEAALPEGWVIWGHQRATKDDAPERDEIIVWAGSWRPSASLQTKGVGRTLTDALRALAARLSQPTQEPGAGR